VTEKIEIPEGPYYLVEDKAEDTVHDKHSGLAMIDTGRTEDWPIARLMEWPTARFVHRAITEYNDLKKGVPTKLLSEEEADALEEIIDSAEYHFNPQDEDVEVFSKKADKARAILVKLREAK